MNSNKRQEGWIEVGGLRRVLRGGNIVYDVSSRMGGVSSMEVWG